MRRRWLLLCFIGLIGAACDKLPASPSTSAVPSLAASAIAFTARPVPVSEEDAEWIFRKTLKRHRDLLSIPGRCGFTSSWTDYEISNYRTDGRLFARAYPALAERLTLEVLNDQEACAFDRSYAWDVLLYLAPRTSPELERFLEEQAAHVDIDNTNEQDSAIRNLAERRFDERTLAICRAQARRGNSAAIDLLTEIVDPPAIALFQEMTGWEKDLPYPLEGLPEHAAHMLQRIAVLESKDWENRIAQIITGLQIKDYSLRVHWALAVARRRPTAGLQAAMQKRLAPSRAAGPPGPYSNDYRDHEYDQVLVGLMRSGGSLTPVEQKYLWQFGFIGNAEARLLELLAERGKYGR